MFDLLDWICFYGKIFSYYIGFDFDYMLFDVIGIFIYQYKYC